MSKGIMEQRPRLHYIDQLKGLAILFVVWGHISVNSTRNDFNYDMNYFYILTFHMPLFAILSGYFFSIKDSLKETLIKKSRRLLVPLLFWCVLGYGIIPLAEASITSWQGGESVHFFAIFRNVCYGVWDWGLWFLRALFLCFIVAIISTRFISKNPVVLLLCSSVLLILLFWFCLPNFGMSLNGLLFLYPFFCIGYVYRQYENVIWKYRKVVFVLSLLIHLLLIVFCWQGYYDTIYQMNTSFWKEEGLKNIVGVTMLQRSALRYAIGLFGCIPYLLFFRWLEEHNYNKGWLFNILETLGFSSIAIYIFHSFLADHFTNGITTDNQLLCIVGCLFMVAVYTAISYFVFRWTIPVRLLRRVMWGMK